jgi:hypothetical protein
VLKHSPTTSSFRGHFHPSYLFRHVFVRRGTFPVTRRLSPKICHQEVRATAAMTNSLRDSEGRGLPGPVGEIPKRLRAYYDSLQEEVIPDRLLDLLEKLEQAERAATMREPSVEELK